VASRGTTSLTWPRALAWRMGRHHLVERAPADDLLRVVGEICGLHAQVMSSAELSLWARVEGLARETVQDALWERRELVKLWGMRGTLHLLPTAELGTWLAAFGTYTHYGNRTPEIDAIADAVREALDGRLLTRDELASEVRHRTGSAMLEEWVRESWGTSLKAISFRGLLCFASSENGRVRFTTPATWVPGVTKPDSARALQEVTRRFLAAYSPVAPAHFGLWWGGTGPTRARRMLEALDGAQVIELGRERVWTLAADLAEIEAATPPRAARLLPAFDPWVVGASRADDAVVAPTHRARVYRAQGWMSPVILVDGRIIGVWKHALKARRIVVELAPFGRLPRWARTELEAEAKRLAAFFERDLELALVS
jgi:winged helix DNA-binding protein